MKTVGTILTSVVLSLVGSYVLVSYVPLSFFPDVIKHTFGSTITTIQGTDTISGSRTTINTNFSNLNTDKIEATQTTLSSLTSAAALATVGTITSGSWTATPVGVAYGGTGTTSPTASLVTLGNGSSGFKTVNGFGTSGQFLTSNGAGVVPSWQSASVDLTLSYTWTGTHAFNSAASTTVANGFYANSIAAAYFIATSTTNSTFRNVLVTGVASTTGYLANYEKITATQALDTGNGNNTSATATCTSGNEIMGGGSDGQGATGYMIYDNGPSGNAWRTSLHCNSTSLGACTGGTLSVYALCANILK